MNVKSFIANWHKEKEMFMEIPKISVTIINESGK